MLICICLDDLNPVYFLNEELLHFCRELHHREKWGGPWSIQDIYIYIYMCTNIYIYIYIYINVVNLGSSSLVARLIRNLPPPEILQLMCSCRLAWSNWVWFVVSNSTTGVGSPSEILGNESPTAYPHCDLPPWMFAMLGSEYTTTTQLPIASSDEIYLQGASGDSFSIFTTLLSSTTSLTFGLPTDCEAILMLTITSSLVCLEIHPILLWSRSSLTRSGVRRQGVMP